MLRLLRIILFPFSIIYGSIVQIRNWMFDFGLLKSYQSSIKVISVGNLNTGGTGKTPFTELLIGALKNRHKIAVLSRGYGRKSKGLKFVEIDSPAIEVGDESLQIKQKFPEILVVVCESRVDAVKVLESQNIGINLIILDDAFQHRYVQRDVDILLTDFKRPFYKDFVLPTGNLREWRSGKSRANLIIVSKGPEELKDDLKNDMLQKIKPNKDQPCFFGFNGYGEVSNLFNQFDKDIGVYNKALVVSGIAHGKDFFEYASSLIPSDVHLNFEDHIIYDRSKIDKVVSKFNSLNEDSPTAILTTRKDAVKLQPFSEDFKKIPVFVLDYKFRIHDYNNCIDKIESGILS